MKKTLISLIALICFLSLIPGLTPVAFAGYSDVPISHEYNKGITFLELSGAINGNKNFHPDENIKKAELFKILFEILGENTNSIKTSGSFTDTSDEAWFAPYAELAKQYGLIDPNQNEFQAENTIKRIDGLKILMNAYGSTGGVIPYSERGKLFMDVPSYHPEYTTISRATEMGLIAANTKETYKPYSKLTRGEFANLIMNLDAKEMINLASEEDGFYKSDILSNMWESITNSFYLPNGETIDEEALFQATVKGMLESLNDPYTKYFSPEDAESFFTSLGDGYEGIGAFIIQDEATGQTFITEFVNGSPAKELGIEIGDEILKVDGTTITGMLVDDIINRIKGPAGTEVILRILRDGKNQDFTITRTELTITLESAEIIYNDVWYLNLDAFANNMHIRVMELLAELEAQEPDPQAIVIDLRGNGGGYMNMGNFIAGMFVPQLTPLIQLDYGESIETIYNGDTGMYYEIPTYILVDEFTASASEIVAATLQEEGNAVIIGKQTFGKGTTQKVITYWDNSMLKFTMAHWLSSQGNSINEVGITPDILITGESETKDLWLEQVHQEL